MTDVAHRWNPDPNHLYGDWFIDPPDLGSDADLRTAIIISLFTDRLALPDDRLPDPTTGDRRGWWGDTSNDPPENIGSRLWLLSREKWTNEVRLRAEDYAREALAWVTADGVADEVLVAAEMAELGRINMGVQLVRAGDRVFQGIFGWAWAQEFLP
jgi:phage gp46-like protein